MVAAIVGPAWWYYGWGLARGSASTDTLVYSVSRRSFAVTLREKGELKAAKDVSVKCEVEGRSTIIWLIEEGVEVAEGDVLVRLASDQIDEKVRSEESNEANSLAAAEAAVKEHEILVDQNASDLRKAQLAVEMAKLELEKYLNGDWKQTQRDVDNAVERAQLVLERAEKEYQDAKELRELQYISEGKLLDDEMAFFDAKAELARAELAKVTAFQYTHKKELEQRQSDVAEAEKELERVRKSNEAKFAKSEANVKAKQADLEFTQQRLAKFRDQQAKCVIRAPASGLVVYDTAGGGRWDRKQIAEGAEVYERQGVIKLPDTSVMTAVVRIHEAKTDKIELGQPVRVEVEGVSGRTFTGKVSKIAVLANSADQWMNPDLKEYETEITLDRTDAVLKPGVTARADILVAEAKDVLSVPVQAVFGKGGKNFVFRGNRRDVEPVEVQVGISNEEYVELASGVSAGDEVLMAVTSEQRALLPEVKPMAKRFGAEEEDLPTSPRGMSPGKGGPGATGAPGGGKRIRGGGEGGGRGGEGGRKAAAGKAAPASSGAVGAGH
jgi:HlyD family secretion protein